MSEDPNFTEPDGAGLPSPEDTPPPRTDAVADLWAKVVDLECEVRFLTAKCDDLRIGSRTMLAVVGPTHPLTPEQSRALLAEPPRLTTDEVFAEFHRLHEERHRPLPPVPPGSTIPGLAKRAATLAARVAELAARRAELRGPYLALANAIEPIRPPTADEIEEMQRAASRPPGPSMLDIIAEVERGLAK